MNYFEALPSTIFQQVPNTHQQPRSATMLKHCTHQMLTLSLFQVDCRVHHTKAATKVTGRRTNARTVCVCTGWQCVRTHVRTVAHTHRHRNAAGRIPQIRTGRSNYIYQYIYTYIYSAHYSDTFFHFLFVFTFMLLLDF